MLRLAAFLLCALASAQEPAEFSTQGIHYFAGRIRCPLAGAGSRGDFHSNRLVLEDASSRVSIDRASTRLRFINTRSYPRKTAVGEVLLLGVAATQSGEKSPIGVHLAIEKRRDKFAARIHVHPTVRDKPVSAEFEPLTVVAFNGRAEETLLTPETALKAILDPSLTARLAGILVEFQDHLEGATQDPGAEGFRLADLSVGIGEGRVSKMVLRTQLVSRSADNRPIILRRSLAEMFQKGDWELRLTSESSLLPKEELQRDLYLMGLDRLPLLAGVMKNGLRKGESLSFRVTDGKGSVAFGGRSADMPNVADVSRAYLEFHFLGSILARQVTHPISGARR